MGALLRPLLVYGAKAPLWLPAQPPTEHSLFVYGKPLHFMLCIPGAAVLYLQVAIEQAESSLEFFESVFLVWPMWTYLHHFDILFSRKFNKNRNGAVLSYVGRAVLPTLGPGFVGFSVMFPMALGFYVCAAWDLSVLIFTLIGSIPFYLLGGGSRASIERKVSFLLLWPRYYKNINLFLGDAETRN